MRIAILRSTVVLLGSAIVLLGVVPPASAGDRIGDLESAGSDRLHMAASVQYVFNKGEDWGLIPVVSIGGGAGLWSAPTERHLLFLHYGVEFGATDPPQSRADVARSLLLPEGISLRLGGAIGSNEPERSRIVFPDVSVAAKVVPWFGDASAIRVGLSGGMAFSARDVFDASLRLTRAVNAIGTRDRQHLMEATGGPDLWSSDVSATAGLHSSRYEVGVFSTFGAYLFDSKFHVPPDAHRFLSLGVRKTFG